MLLSLEPTNVECQRLRSAIGGGFMSAITFQRQWWGGRWLGWRLGERSVWTWCHVSSYGRKNQCIYYNFWDVVVGSCLGWNWSLWTSYIHRIHHLHLQQLHRQVTSPPPSLMALPSSHPPAPSVVGPSANHSLLHTATTLIVGSPLQPSASQVYC